MSAAVFLMLQAASGLDFRLDNGELCFTRARLPPMLDWMKISGFSVEEAFVDVMLRRHGHNTVIDVLQKRGGVEVVAVM